MADFLDRVLVGINKGVNTVSENSKFIVEKARLNTQIKETEDEKLKLAQQLGVLAYNMQTRGDIDIEQFQAICDDITQLNEDIDKLKHEVQSLESNKSISQINETSTIVDGVQCSCRYINKSGSKFCANCGRKLD